MTFATSKIRPRLTPPGQGSPLVVAVFGCDVAATDDAIGGFDRALQVFRDARLAADGQVEFQLVSLGAEAVVDAIEPGIVTFRLSANRQPLFLRTAAAWGIADIVAACDLIHLWRFDWRLCDAALLAAKLAGAPVVANEVEPDFATLAAQLGLKRLADGIVSIAELHSPRAGDALWRAYAALAPAVPRRRGAA